MQIAAFLATFLATLCVQAVGTASRNHGNPIRKVVTMLQDMQKSVEEEGLKEKELYDKFMCYCQTTEAQLATSIETATSKVAELESGIQEGVATKNQLDQEVAGHKADREQATKAVAEATSMRDKESAENAAATAEMKTNIESLKGALVALKKGLTTEFLQTQAGQVLRSIVSHSPAVDESERSILTNFLDTGEGGTDQIIGVISQMIEEMSSALKDAEADEKEAAANFENLRAAKSKEIAAATKAVEEKTARSGEVAVAEVQNKADLENTQNALEEDTKMKGNLAKTCATKTKEFEERSKTRAQEIQAISETIKILNDDDALELFKKTLPGPVEPAMFMQMSSKAMSKAKVHRAMSLMKDMMYQDPDAAHRMNYKMMLSQVKSSSRKGGFEKILKMVDDMVTILMNEQDDDDTKKEFCVSEMDKTEDEQKLLEGTVADVESLINEKADAIQGIAQEIATIKNGIKELDKSVATATEQRKMEHAEFMEVSAANQAAVNLLGMAKKRLAKFYSPKANLLQYKSQAPVNEGAPERMNLFEAPNQQDQQEERALDQSMQATPAVPSSDSGAMDQVFGDAGSDQEQVHDLSFVQTRTKVSMRARMRAKARARFGFQMEEPPENGASLLSYGKGSQAGAAGGVLAMIDQLVHDVELNQQEAKQEEEDAQTEYEEAMNDSSQKREGDSKLIVTKQSEKAKLTAVLEDAKAEKSLKENQVKIQVEKLSDLHASCDFLLENYDVRKKARTTEIEGLKQSKAVLSGANFGGASFMQRH
eukprot:gnl/MRDRNA2_/MRDRNA2_100510_c0_seq1.p1 gnl/MRDRNA2_/MRDRNA2_100510_c0~~gnl/MRDRNA2_/MRDRNA2_100510_c0_seq1.p1  ORF type:complete len:769 (-),score=251.18 gnl/MRDRNA2_/MRDRNA2_100510_c0_seq1:91-2397(-)